MKQITPQTGSLKTVFSCVLFLGFCGSSIRDQPVWVVLARDLGGLWAWSQIKGSCAPVSGSWAGKTWMAGGQNCWLSTGISCLSLHALSLWGYPGMVVSTLQRNTPQERQPGRSCITFDELASKATQNHFCYLLLLRSKSLRPAQYLKGGELGLLMGGVSNHTQPCVKTTAPLTGTGLACVCLLIWMSLVEWEKIQGCSLLEILGVRSLF